MSNNYPTCVPLITEFTSDGTWTPNPNAKETEFYEWGGGGGGGSGRSGASASAHGGGGGAPGQILYMRVPSSKIPAGPHEVTIGLGGIGGVEISGTLENGNSGSNGGDTSIGSLFIAKGGLGGNGGTTLNTARVISTAVIQIGSSPTTTPMLSGGGSFTDGPPGNDFATDGTSAIFGWALGGGGGAPYIASTAREGGNGGSILNGDGSVLNAGGVAGSDSGESGGNGNDSSVSYTFCGGTGGGGGGHDGATTAGSGGSGGGPGGGGGGGAGNLSGNPSGAGGDGADGKVIIIEYF